MTQATAPQLTVITTVQDDYVNLIFKVAMDVRMQSAKGEEVNVYEIIDLFVDPKKNNSELEKACVEAGLMSKSEFKNAIKQKVKNDKIMAALGYIPSTVSSYIKGFVKAHGITVRLTGDLKRKWVVKIADQVVTEADCQDPEIKKAYMIRSNRSFNVEDMKLNLRSIRDELQLPFHDSQIADAVEVWVEDGKAERLNDMFENIKYTPGKATGPLGQAMWEKMEAATFDVTETTKGFAIAILKKFMWQVKRKGFGLPVTNHLMPVITGKQGGGKSTLITNMTSFMDDGVKQAQFTDLSNDKLIPLWSTPILMMDEMAGAKKADMNVVKQCITATTLTRRPMRSNCDIQVEQKSTLIGCSNDSLSEIIRDNTGVRRFAELAFSKNPDWKAMGEIDWLMLWHSVDEEGADPSIHVFDVLKEQQAVNRNMDPVEMWAREHNNETQYKTWLKSGYLHEQFTDWEKDKFPGYNTSISTFGKKMKTLMTQYPDLGWEFQSKSGFSWMKAI